MQLKLQRRKYRTLADFDADASLMFRNCYEFNNEEEDVYMVSKATTT